MAFPVIPIIGIVGQVLDKLFPDPAERAAAEERLRSLEMSGELKKIDMHLNTIILEANSQSKFTRMARPGFMYVLYVYLLVAFPFMIISGFSTEISGNMISGIKGFLSAIPTEMWTLFGAGYLGYTSARTIEKRKFIDKNSDY